MKYPQVVSMPAHISDWLANELESHGIDATIYMRYLVSLLICYQDSINILSEQEDGIMMPMSPAGSSVVATASPQNNIGCRNNKSERYSLGRRRRVRSSIAQNHAGGRWDGVDFSAATAGNAIALRCQQHQRNWKSAVVRLHRLSEQDVDRFRRSAAVNCLVSAADDDAAAEQSCVCGLETLVDELCEKLKLLTAAGGSERNSGDLLAAPDAADISTDPDLATTTDDDGYDEPPTLDEQQERYRHLEECPSPHNLKWKLSTAEKRYYDAFPALETTATKTGHNKSAGRGRRNAGCIAANNFNSNPPQHGATVAAATAGASKMRFYRPKYIQGDWFMNETKKHIDTIMMQDEQKLSKDRSQQDDGNDSERDEERDDEASELHQRDLSLDIIRVILDDTPSDKYIEYQPEKEYAFDNSFSNNIDPQKFISSGTNILNSIWSTGYENEFPNFWYDQWNEKPDQQLDDDELKRTFESGSEDPEIPDDIEEDDFSAQDSEVEYLISSLNKINHSYEFSSFSAIRPRRVPVVQNLCAINPPVMSASLAVDDSDCGEDLLHSKKSHFRPISRTGGNDNLNKVSTTTAGSTMTTAGDTATTGYADGTTFVINCSLDEPRYQRNESGRLFLETDEGREQYMHLVKDSHNDTTECNNNSDSNDQSSNGFLLKFHFKQNDKGCQTESDLGLINKRETRTGSLDEEYLYTDDFYFPGDQQCLSDGIDSGDDNSVVGGYAEENQPNEQVLVDNKKMEELFACIELKCDKCATAAIMTESLMHLENYTGGSGAPSQPSTTNIWNGGELCIACLQLNICPSILSTNQNASDGVGGDDTADMVPIIGPVSFIDEERRLRLDIKRDGEQLLSDLSSVQNRFRLEEKFVAVQVYQSYQPALEETAPIMDEEFTDYYLRKNFCKHDADDDPHRRRVKFHSAPFSFTSTLDTECLMHIIPPTSTIPTLRSVTL